MGNSSAVQRQKDHEHEPELDRDQNFGTGSRAMGNSSAVQRQNVHEPETVLDENCISAILSFTTPRDISRLAAVSKLFRSAAYSDSVWNKFLPQQCYQILPRAVIPVQFVSRRELYFRLCDSILIDGGTKIFWLERSTAKIGYMLSARALWITWGNDHRYWRWVSQDDSRFDEIAELLDVCWLEVGGAMDCRLLSADTEYRVVFVLKLKAGSHGFDTMQFLVTTPEGEEMNSEQPLLETEWVANEGWMEMVAGEFTVKAAEDIQYDDSSSMSFRMRDLSSWWKSGLLIDGVKIEPKST